MKGIEVAFIGRVVRPLTERTSTDGHRWGHILGAYGEQDVTPSIALVRCSFGEGADDTANEGDLDPFHAAHSRGIRAKDRSTPDFRAKASPA